MIDAEHATVPVAIHLAGVSVAPRRGACTDVGLNVAAGESLALLGSAGAGKTTLLRVMGGALRPVCGTVEIGGRRVRAAGDQPGGVGLCTAQNDLIPQMTLFENVALPLHGRMPASAAGQRVAHVMEALDLGALSGVQAAHISFADGRRAALARALVRAPRLLLLDEPFCACDPDRRPWLRHAVRTLAEGATIVCATRQAEDALAWSDHVAVLEAGHLLQFGTPDAVYRMPESLAVARATGELNTLPGRVHALQDDEAAVELPDGRLLYAMAIGLGAVGQPCLLTVRPERVALATVAADDMGEGAIAGTIQMVRRLGASVAVTVQLGAGALLLRRPTVPPVVAGQPVSVAWQAGDAWAFPVP